MIEQLDRRVLLSSTILSGQTVAGVIPGAGQQVTYSFAASANQSVTLSVGDPNAASTYEPFFHVFDQNNNDINNGYSVNSGGATDSSAIDRFQVPANGGGNYTVVLQNYSATATGAFDVELAEAPATQQADADGDGGTIVSGQTKTGTINRPGDLDVYTFSASANQSVTLSVGDPNSASTDEPFFHVFDPSGNDVYDNYSYNSGGATDSSAIARFQVPSTGGGTYTVVVTNYSASATGAYDIELAEATTTQQADADGDGGPILSGQTKTGTINRPGDLDIYTFSAAANASVALSVGDPNSSSTYEPLFHIFDPSGNDVYDNYSYNSGGATDSSAIARFQVPTTGGGTYTVVVTNYSASATGAYDVELATATTTQQADADGDGGTIVSGQTKTGTINRPGDLDIFTFNAAANASVTLSAGDPDSTSAYEPLYHIYDPSGNDVYDNYSYNSGGATDSSAIARFQVPSTGGGTYTVVLTNYSASATGAYDLELGEAPATQQPDADGDGGTIVSGLTKSGTINRPGDLDIYTFSASANNAVVLSVGDSNSTTTYQPYFHVYDPSGNDVNDNYSYNTGGNTNSTATADFTVPSTGGGTYTLVVTSYAASSTGAYNINLSGAVPSAIAPAVASTQIGTGSVQRSSIKTFSVTFNEPVTLAAGAYTLYQEPTTSTGAINTSGTPTDVSTGITAASSGNTVTFTITPGGSLDRTGTTKAGLLSNGIYRLVLHGSKITDAATGTTTLNGGVDLNVSFASAEATGGSSTYFHVLFGDYNGDGKVNLVDYRQLAKDFLSTTGASNFDTSFDYNGDGSIGLIDYRQFAVDYLKSFSY